MKFTVVYSILVCITAIRGSNVCTTSSKEVDPTCPTDCSQNDTRVHGEVSVFSCTIGGIDYIQRYKTFNPAYFLSDTELIFAAPTLLDIEFYRRKLPFGNFADNPSLSIRFLIPKGVEPKDSHEIIFPEAVLMKFQSIADKMHKDWFYFHCPRYRIFRFHNYAPKSSYEALNPRNISFDCLVGLNDTASYQLRVYKIKLETVRGQAAIYTVTVNVVVDLLDPALWQTVIATHVDEERHTVYVVFQKLLKSHVYGYVVELFNGDEKVQTKKLPPMNNTVLFKDVGFGKYVVKVSVISSTCLTDSACMTTTSYVIDLSGTADFGEDHMKIVAMVIGCLLGVLVVLLLGLGLFRLHKTRKGPLQGWIIHPFQYGTEQYGIVEKFTESLEDMCHCSIQKHRPGDWGEITDKATMKEWCGNTLNKHTQFVLIFFSESAFKDINECTYNNFYSYTINAAVDRKKSKNSLRIFVVNFSSSKSQLPPLLKDCAAFELIDEFLDVCTEIKNLNQHAPSANKPLLPNRNVQELKLAVEKVKNPPQAQASNLTPNVDEENSNPQIDCDHDTEPTLDCNAETIKNNRKNKHKCEQSSAKKKLVELAFALNPSSSEDDLSSETETLDTGKDTDDYKHCVVGEGYVSEEILQLRQNINEQSAENLSLSDVMHNGDNMDHRSQKAQLNSGYLPHEAMNSCSNITGAAVKPKVWDKHNIYTDKHVGFSEQGWHINDAGALSKNTANISNNQDYVIMTDSGACQNSLGRCGHGLDRSVHDLDRSGSGLDESGHGIKKSGRGFNRSGHGIDRNERGLDRNGSSLEYNGILPHYVANTQTADCFRHSKPYNTQPIRSDISNNRSSPDAQNNIMRPDYLDYNQLYDGNGLSNHPSNNSFRIPRPKSTDMVDIELANAYNEHGHVPSTSNQYNTNYVAHSDIHPVFQQVNQNNVILPQKQPYVHNILDLLAGSRQLHTHIGSQQQRNSLLPHFQIGSQQQCLQTDSQNKFLNPGSQQQCLQNGSQYPYLNAGSKEQCLQTDPRNKYLNDGNPQKYLQTGSPQNVCLQQPCLHAVPQKRHLQTGINMNGLKTNNTVHFDLASVNVLSPDSSLESETSFSEPNFSHSRPPSNDLNPDNGTSAYVTNIVDGLKSGLISTIPDNEITFPPVDPTVVEKQSAALNSNNKIDVDFEHFNPIPPEEDNTPYGSMSDVMEKLESYN